MQELAGWQLLPSSSSRGYLLLQTPLSWAQAEDACQALYGHLARGMANVTIFNIPIARSKANAKNFLCRLNFCSLSRLIEYNNKER